MPDSVHNQLVFWRRWLDLTVETLTSHRAQLDALNVFPIPDSDTGTNLLATFTAAASARSADAAELLTQAAVAATHAAQGNSGTIAAAWLSGLAQEPGAPIARALQNAADKARAAIAEPVDGTIITIAQEAASAAQDNPEPEWAAAVAAGHAVTLTPSQLPALGRAGVVDAGARGLALVLEALAAAHGITSNTACAAPEVNPVFAAEQGIRFEVQYLLDAPASEELVERLERLGDSVVVAGDGPCQVHVHADDAGAAIEAGLRFGGLSQVRVTVIAQSPMPRRVVVSCVQGSGLRDMFEAAGAVTISTDVGVAELTHAITHAGASQVIVLPNDYQLGLVADSAVEVARAQGVGANVVHTHSPVQAIAALAVHDAHRRFDDDVVAMAEAARAMRWVRVFQVTEYAWTMAGAAHQGDFAAIVDGEVRLLGAELREVCEQALAAVVGGAELVTLVTGARLSSDLTGELVRFVAQRWRYAECQVIAGGQDDALLLIGVE
ncbi:MAG: DAK2 domain-containing protein [Corynebacteriales bacterium]|nr:DAK2 domain-containing protein [Mycobacteriales bacterium]